MPLPSTAPTNPSSQAQMSIKSFFQPRPPNYAPPPGQTKPSIEATRPASLTPTTAQPATAAPLAPVPDAPRPAFVSSSRPIPSQAAIREVTEADVQALRRINSLLLPINYPDAFYRAVLDPAASASFSRVIFWTDSASKQAAEPIVVGGVVCRMDPVAPEIAATGQPEHALYIQSLCLLSPYRSFGLATAALNDIIAAAAADPRFNVRYVYAHVWTENDDGLRWYQARGFQRDDKPIEGYYLRLRPGSAWIVRRSAVLPAIRGSFATGTRTTLGAPEPIQPSTTAAAVNLLSSAVDSAGPSRGAMPTPPPPRTGSGQSYQNRRADMEWNDLPADMAPGRLVPPGSNGGSGASSRSSSTARKKKERAYPAAAFGS